MVTIRKAIRKIIEDTLKKSDYSFDEIILFGSRAKGNYNKDSDWDILVVLSNEIDHQERKGVWYMIYRNLHRKFPFSSFDIIIKSKPEYIREKEVVNTLSNEIITEGTPL